MGSRSAPARAKPTLTARLGDFLLTILAIAGSLCLLLVILSFTLNISIMMFKTGSMSPTITAGSIALVKEIPASELVVGDIATVQRGQGELPVTHRVTAIKDIADDGTVTFTMKGDGNETPDVDPYTASTVQRVFFSVPGLAPLIQKFNSPYVLGVLTLGAAALVVWAFWPRDQGEEEELSAQVPKQIDSQHAVLLPAVLLAVAAAIVPASPNSTIQTAEGEYLRLRSVSSAAMSSMSPGQSATWTTDVWADAPDEGLIDVEVHISPQQDEPSPWELTVIGCSLLGDEHLPDCGEPPRELLSAQPASNATNNTGINVASFSSEERHRFQVVVSLSSEFSAGDSISPLEVKLIAKGLGEDLATSPEPSDPESPNGTVDDGPNLAETGTANLPAFLLLALVLVALGLSLRVLGRRRQHG